MPDDPYRHHPRLRGKIKPAAESFFRELDMAMVDARVREAGMRADWRTPDDVREAGRRAFLAGREGRDLWVFAFGSLMWDPGIEFVEIRRARAPEHARRFCLVDQGGRGSAEAPGLQLALDTGSGCDGLAFRIAAEAVEHESFVLFRREMIAAGYLPVWLALETAQGAVEALGFAADHACEDIVTDIPLDEQARMIAHAAGFLGTNYEYLAGTRSQLEGLGVSDPYIDAVFARVEALRAAQA
ncbi:MAG: gamma-glutamylcyclotransferase [Rhodobacteraceae bacterium]|nr:gamma-glutamylcyclotransferase [Paracoccaceae bacterium]